MHQPVQATTLQLALPRQESSLSQHSKALGRALVKASSLILQYFSAKYLQEAVILLDAARCFLIAVGVYCGTAGSSSLQCGTCG